MNIFAWIRLLLAVGFVSLSCAARAQTSETGHSANKTFRFAVISDPQIRAEDHYWTGICREALEDLGQFEKRPSFVMATGDLVDGRSGKNLDCPASIYHSQYKILFGLLDKHLHRSIQFYPVVGNHEYHRSADGSPSGPELYAKYWFDRIPAGVLPRNSPYYSFDHGNVHFVVICTGLLGVKKVPDYQDLVYGKQYKWLAKDLQGASQRDNIDHILVFGHHNFHPVRAKGKSDWEGLETIRQRIWKDLFVKHGVKAYFHGHWHFYDRGVPEGGIPYICLGGLDGQETPEFPQLKVNHYALVDVEVASIQVRVYLLGRTLYDQFELHELAAGKVAPPQETVAKALRDPS